MIGLNRPRNGWGQFARVALGLVLAGAITSGAIIGLRARSTPGDRTHQAAASVAPLQASGVFSCPAGNPVPAYPSGFSYPPGHPLRPSSTVRPAACYVTPSDAVNAGYPPAALPLGAKVVHGIYLMPTGKNLLRQCLTAARALAFAVPCPSLLPTSNPPPTCGTDGDGACISGQVFVFMQIGFDVPADYVGVDGRDEGHLVLIGSRRPDDELVNCFGGRTVGRTQLPGTTASLIECPEASGVHGGHLMLHWQAGTVSIALSLHGVTEVNRTLLLDIAKGVRLRAP